jgi:hypothetical protein
LSDLRLRIDQTPNFLKQAIGWLAGTLSRAKLHPQISGPLGRLEALETLAIGIQGKLALWRALRVAVDPSLTGADYEHLSARALAQSDEVEARRLDVARAVLGKPRRPDVSWRSMTRRWAEVSRRCALSQRRS